MGRNVNTKLTTSTHLIVPHIPNSHILLNSAIKLKYKKKKSGKTKNAFKSNRASLNIGLAWYFYPILVMSLISDLGGAGFSMSFMDNSH